MVALADGKPVAVLRTPASASGMILGIDVCTGFCAAAIVDGPRVIAAAQEAMTRGHVERLTPMVDEILTASGATPSDLAAIAVTTGPGSFTGARLGVSFARGLALSLGVPAVGVSVFEAMAPSFPNGALLIALSGKGDAISVQAFNDGVAHAPPRSVLIADGWQDARSTGEVTVIGSEAERLIALSDQSFQNRAVLAATPAITPATVARIAAEKLSEGETPRPAPLYLRAADAKPQAAVTFT